MSHYVDGFLIPVANDKVDDYRKIAAQAAEVWKEYGAVSYYECVADDLDVEEMASFRDAAGAGEDETVIFSWIVYESREHRDKVNAAIMEDPRIANMMEPDNHPFDSRRMAYGGFRVVVSL